MEQFCEKLTARYFTAALQAVRDTVTNDDDATNAAMDQSGPKAQRIGTVADWIRLYKVHRVKWRPDGVDPSFADAAARVAIEQFDAWRDSRPDPVNAYAVLRQAIGHLHEENSGEERKFRSLTAKVLWCRFPDSVAIYDELASVAVTFLIKVYKAYELPGEYLAGSEEQKYNEGLAFGDWGRLSKAEQDIWWYRDFYRSHHVLYTIFEPSIVARLNAIPDAPGAFRVFDKFLWLFGNDNADYSLIGER